MDFNCQNIFGHCWCKNNIETYAANIYRMNATRKSIVGIIHLKWSLLICMFTMWSHQYGNEDILLEQIGYVWKTWTFEIN